MLKSQTANGINERVPHRQNVLHQRLRKATGSGNISKKTAGFTIR